MRPRFAAISLLLLVGFTAGAIAQSADSVDRSRQVRSDDVDVIVEHATSLRRLNQRRQALEEIERAAVLTPSRDDVLALRRLRRYEVSGSDLTLATNYDRWENRDPRRETLVDLRHNAQWGSAIVRYAHATAFGQQDDKVEVEAYPEFRGGYGYVAVGAAPAARLYPHSTVAAELFRTVVSGVEGSVGYRRLNFADAVNVFTGSAGFYESDYLLSARLNRVTGGASGTSVVLSARRVFADPTQWVGVHVAAGSIREDIRTVADFNATSSRAAGAEAVLLLHGWWILLLRAEGGRDESRTSGPVLRASGSAGFGVRF